MEINQPSKTVEEGYTISVTPANSFGKILNTEPIEIEPKSDVNINLKSLDKDDDKKDLYQPENVKDISFDDVVGLRTAKERLFEAVRLPMEKEKKVEEFGLERQFGILFYGPPGTGKTMMAKAAANEWGSSKLFFHNGGPEIVSKYYGESERQIREVFDTAERRSEEEGEPAFVFIDELDSIVPRRDQADETERRIVAQFLSALDGLEERGDVIVIGATNLIEGIDQAVRRPGRFDEEIEFSLPDPDERLEILQKHSSDMPLSPSVDLEQIAQETESWSGADLKSVVKKAGTIAVKEDRSAADHEDFEIALERFGEQQRRKQEQFQKAEDR